jgi:hypothetical protein
MLEYGPDKQTITVPSQAKATYFSLLQNVRVGSGAYSASCLMEKPDAFPEDKSTDIILLGFAQGCHVSGR